MLDDSEVVLIAKKRGLAVVSDKTGRNNQLTSPTSLKQLICCVCGEASDSRYCRRCEVREERRMMRIG